MSEEQAGPRHLANRKAAKHVCVGDVVLVVSTLIVALLGGIYTELYLDAATLSRSGEVTGLFASAYNALAWARIPLIALCLFALGLVVLAHPRTVHHLMRARFVIVAIVLLVSIVFEISGSSLAYWSSATGGVSFEGTLFGIPRGIRSDEWDVLTPFAFSQASTGFQAISPAIRGGGTDMTMVYASPAWAVATLFRPFLWGYLALGAERGLAFFWTARLLALFLVTYQFGLLLCRGDERIALTGGLLVTFSPIVQWWFAVNGTAELFVFGQGLVLALHSLLYARTRRGRWALAGLIAWLMGCYLLILYPSWQVPLFYVFLALGVWVFARWFRSSSSDGRRMQLRRLGVPVLVCDAVIVVMVVYCLCFSRDTIMAVMGSVYPGRRAETGGGLLAYLPNLTTNLAAPLEEAHMTPNACESATFIGLFPLGIVLGVWQLLRRHDGALAAMLVVYALFGFYGVIGLPLSLARVLLLSNVQTSRIVMATGYLDVMLLLRALSDVKVSVSHQVICKRSGTHTVTALLFSLAFAATWALAGHFANQEAMGKWTCGVSFGLTFVICIAAVLPQVDVSSSGREVLRGNLLVLGAFLVALSGFFVNPVQQGADALTANEVVRISREVSEADSSARWITDNAMTGQLLVSRGIPTINSVNTYPDLQLWQAIDPKDAYEDVYNRYAHINIEPTAEGEETWFEMSQQADLITVHIAADDLRKIDARYWLSSLDLVEHCTQSTTFVPVCTAGPYTVYRIDYS